MLIEELIKNKNVLLICPSSYKKYLLRYLNKNKIIADISFITLEEYRKSFCFDYDYKAIKYLIKKENISVENAEELLSNIYYVDETKAYGNQKLDYLVAIKKELINNNLLIFNPLFKDYLKSKNIYIVGYGKLLKQDMTILNNAIYLEEQKIDKHYIINEFKDIESEVEYLYNSIFELLNKDVDINSIKIININSEYYPYLKRYNDYYPFKIEIKNDDTLFGTELCKEVIKLIDTNNKEDIYQKFADYEDENAQKIINILNKYPEEELRDVKELIINDLSNTKINAPRYQNIAECKDINDLFEDEHVFLVGYNEAFPNYKKDTEYITNNIRDLINKDTIEVENELIKNNLINHLSNIQNLYISYNKQTAFNKHELSILFNEKDYEIKTINNEYKYSKEANRVRYGLMLDDLKKYNIQDKEILAKLHKEFKLGDYDSYSNKFKGLTNNQIDNLGKIKLSYTSMNEFYKCNFAYYLDRILNINKNVDTLALKIGDICHAVLEKMYDQDFDFDVAFNNAIEDYKNAHNGIYCDEKEEYFITKAKDDLKETINLLNEQDSMSKLRDHKQELSLDLNISNKLAFTGKIDKLNIHKEDNKQIVSIVDYKTGSSSELNRKIMDFGLSLQVPTYLYLLKNLKEYKDAEVAGFYLQHISNKLHNYQEDKTIIEQKKDDLKLDGYSSSDLDRLSNIEFDITSKNKSDVIKGLSIKKGGGFDARSKVLDDKELNDLTDLVKQKIEEAGKAILTGDFKINPKIIDKKNKSCEYCLYSDICYRKIEDNVYLSTKENG